MDSATIRRHSYTVKKRRNLSDNCICLFDWNILSGHRIFNRSNDMNDFTCVICDKEVKGEFGNNPDPIALEGECCNECDNSVVMTARLNQLGIG